jgi:hypothetical protein
MKKSDFLDHQETSYTTIKGLSDVLAGPQLKRCKNVKFKGEENLLVNSKDRNNNDPNNMISQACDKGFDIYCNMETEEHLRFRFIRIIFDCFIKRSNFKA